MPTQSYTNPNYAYSTSNPPFQNSQAIPRTQAPGPIYNAPQRGPQQNYPNFQSQQPPNQNFNRPYDQPNPQIGHQNLQGGYPNQAQQPIYQNQQYSQNPMEFKPQYITPQNQINPQFQTLQGGNYNPPINQGPFPQQQPQMQNPRILDPRLNNSSQYYQGQGQVQLQQPQLQLQVQPQSQYQPQPQLQRQQPGLYMPQQNFPQNIPQNNLQQQGPPLQYENNPRGNFYPPQQQQGQGFGPGLGPNQGPINNQQIYQTIPPQQININQRIPQNEPYYVNNNYPQPQTFLKLPENQNIQQQQQPGGPPLQIAPLIPENKQSTPPPQQNQDEVIVIDEEPSQEQQNLPVIHNPYKNYEAPGSQFAGVLNIEGLRKISPAFPTEQEQISEQPTKKPLSFFIDNTPIASVTSNENEAEKKVESNRDVETEEKSYRILGYDRSFRTQEKNLLEKLQKFLGSNEEEKAEKDKKAAAAKAEKELEEKKEEAVGDEFNFESRYFIYNPTQVCNRCKKPGHFEKWCTEEVVLKCMFCFGPHRMDECTQIICFNCNGVGHRNRECRVRDTITCFRCGKRGHKNTRCGVLLPKDKEVLRREKRDYNISTKCLVCGNYGHPVCRKEDAPEFRNGYLDELYEEQHEPKDENNRKSSADEESEDYEEEGYTKKKLKTDTDQTAATKA